MKRRGPPEDPQRDAVYAMEKEELAGHVSHQIPLHQLRRWARTICREYDIAQARVTAKEHRGFGGLYDPNTATIYLDPTQGKNGLTLAHELAHHVTVIKHPRAHDHGPTWLARYAEILDVMRLVPRAGMRAIARRHMVGIARV